MAETNAERNKLKTYTTFGDEVVIDMELQLRGELSATLLKEAQSRGVKPIDLMADIINTVLRENLVKAVLDDG